ncbi:hypothetical protein ACTMU2_05990 [Cupriavidus basilensis]
MVDNDQAFATLRDLIYSNVGGTLVAALDDTLRAFNPRLRHVETNAEGYAVVTLTADKLNCAFHVMKRLEGTTAPAQPATASVRVFEVAAGSTVVNGV